MPLPILVIYEFHTDPRPKQVLIEIIDKLKSLGYNTLCVEDPSDLPFAEMIDKKRTAVSLTEQLLGQIFPILERENIDINRLNWPNLTNFIKRYYSQNNHYYFTSAIKSYDANKEDIKFLLVAKEKQLEIVPIDILNQQCSEVCGSKTTEFKLSQFNERIDKTLPQRVALSFEKVKILYEAGKNIVVFQGARHYPLLSDHFTEYSKIPVEHFFIYSTDLNQTIEENIVEKVLFKNIKGLQTIAFPIDSQNDIAPLMEKITTRIDQERQEQQRSSLRPI